MKQDPIIICDNLCVSYGREDVLRDVKLTVNRGAFLPFVGPNGAGKTTLLRTILGLIKPRKGTVRTSFYPPYAGYVTQHKEIDPLYPVSVRQIVMMGLYPQLGWWRRPAPDHRRAVREALDRFGLLEHRDKTFSELSGGMKQKALLARAFVTNAEVLIMDEPTSDLDVESEKDVLGHLLRLNRECGRTVLLAIHGIARIRDFSGTIIRIDHGQVQVSGPEGARG